MVNLVAWALTAAILTSCGSVTDSGASLDGKSAAFMGDSVAYGTNFEGGYCKIIGNDENMNVTNAAKGGASIARNVRWSSDSDAYRPCIIDQIEGLEGEFDYIIVEGGINDFWNHTPIGELSDSFEGGYDEETFAGAMETIFYDVSVLHPESKAGFVIIHDSFTYDAEADFEKYYNMMKSACDKWSVPYLDLYAENNQTKGVNVRDAEQKKLYFGSDDRPDGDGTHPNELGYQTIYVEPMVEWMKIL